MSDQRWFDAKPKLRRILCCPKCKSGTLRLDEAAISCANCGDSYDVLEGTPVLIKRNSPVLSWYEPRRDESAFASQKFSGLYWRLRPEARLWTRRSIKALQSLLDHVNPDSNERTAVLVGAGFESAYRRMLGPYKDVIRIGLASRGEVDVLNDVCDIPLLSDSVDLLFSSSVLEHVYDPERAIAEMFRVIRPGGYVYAEIPFMRGFHMIPVDYQRYTIAGIEALFARHGFALVEKGICSGPFTAWALLHVDLIGSFFSFSRYVKALMVLLLSLLVHPVKYLDRLFETSKWAEITACNFYYVGKKQGASS